MQLFHILILLVVYATSSQANDVVTELGEQLSQHRCVEKTRISDDYCASTDFECLSKGIKIVILVIDKDEDMRDCLFDLIAEFPELNFVRQYIKHRWYVAEFIP